MRRSSFHLSKTLLLLILLAINIVGNGDGGGVSAQNAQGDQVLYSNPQFYTLSDEQQQVASASAVQAPPENHTVVGLLFNVRSKLVEEDAAIYITGFEFYTSISGNVYYQLFSREGEYYDTEEGMDGGPGIGAWDPILQKDMISGGLADGSGECTEILQGYSSGDAAAAGGDYYHASSSHLFGTNDDKESIDPAEIVAKSTTTGDTTMPSCPLTIVPTEDFPLSSESKINYPWTLRGPNSTRSFYITLASKHLYASPRRTTDPFDSVLAASTPELELYEGVAARTYPLHLNQSAYYHDFPMGFIGKIHYRVEGKAPVVEDDAPSMAPSTFPSTTLTPTITYNGTRAPISSTFHPSASTTLKPASAAPTPRPTRRCRPGRPCLSQPTPKSSAPTPSPLISGPKRITIELMVYMENVPDRVMNDREKKEYVEVLLESLQEDEELKKNGVATKSVELFHHNVIEEEKGKRKGKGKVGRGGIDAGNKWKESDESYVYEYNTESSFKPKRHPAIYVMTKVGVLTRLPYDVAAFFVWDELREHETTLIETFHDNSLFVSYFRDLTNITFEVHEGLTKPPTLAPTKAIAEIVEEDTDDEEAKAEERRNVYSYVGFVVGILWLCLTLCSFREIFKHRQKAKKRSSLRRTQMVRLQSSFDRATRLSQKSFGNMALRRLTKDWTGRAQKRKSARDMFDDIAAEAESSDDSSTEEETERSPKRHRSDGSERQRQPKQVSFA